MRCSSGSLPPEKTGVSMEIFIPGQFLAARQVTCHQQGKARHQHGGMAWSVPRERARIAEIKLMIPIKPISSGTSQPQVLTHSARRQCRATSIATTANRNRSKRLHS